jgi:hypothetical protein
LKSIAIIVLNWCGWQDTLVCLASLKKLIINKPVSIIVCDNASEDDSYAHILNWAQQHYMPSEIGIFSPTSNSRILNPDSPCPFVLIQTGANLGFAGGNNVGIRYVLANQHFDYLWLLNNDTVVEVDALLTLYEYAVAHPKMALVGCTVIDYYQVDTVQCAGGCRYWPLLTVFKPNLGGQLVSAVMQNEEPLSLDYIYGAAMFLKVDAVREIGLLNEEYFLFYEELDYSQRLKKAGYTMGWCRKSKVYHKGSASVGSVKEGNRDKRRQANYYENLSTLKYTANFYPRLLPLVMITRFFGKALVLSLRRDFYLLAPLFQAYRNFMQKQNKY